MKRLLSLCRDRFDTAFHAMIFALLFFLSGTAHAQVSKLNTIKNPTLAELRENFKRPHRDYSTGPLWTWNDRLTEEQVRGTLRDLAGQNVRQVWVHPRPGLMTPYLSEEWFALWKIALDEAEKLDMNVWIYDENSYPSGFAGGFVPEALPESRGMGLKFEEQVFGDNLHHVDGPNVWYAWKSEKDENGTETWKHIYTKSETTPEPQSFTPGKYLIGRVHYTPLGGWFGGKWYVDLLKRGVTEKFIETTFDAYGNVPEIRGEFGRRVPGIFTDEPHPAGSYVGTWVTWNEEIPELFERKFGYSLIEHLPSLHKPAGDWKKVRHNYHALILELFVDRWARPCFEWCEAYNLEFTGHYWEHGWPGTSHGPDNMAMYVWHQRPAIDLLMNTYDDGSPNAQFGNVRSVKELASVANQMGRSRTLSENYGAGGWDLRFEDMKRLGDWSYALGVNTNNEHLSYVTIRGARKRDHPQSFSYHAPWFEGYHTLADYFNRLSYVLSQGRQVNRIVVIEPTTTAWMYQGDPKLGEIGRSFTDFVNALEQAQVEYDLASEDIIARFGKVEGKTFSINQANYDLVILPPMMENANGKTAELLAEYAENGGTLFCAGELPSRIDGVKTESVLLKGVVKSLPEDAVRIGAVRTADDGFALQLKGDRQSWPTTIFHHRRRLNDCEILFLINTDMERSVEGMAINSLSTFDTQVEQWDLETGNVFSYGHGYVNEGADMAIHFELPPCGSLLFVLSDSSAEPPPGLTSGALLEAKAIPGSETAIKRLEPNVLTLDFVDVKVGDEERKDVYTWQANRWIFQKHGFPAGNPWDSQVQFKDELITKKFPEGSGFEATYRFIVAGTDVPASLKVVIERPDLYEITCNNEPGIVSRDSWWLDRSFGVIDLSKTAKTGENEIKIVARTMTIEHELEPAYLLGDFSLENAEKGFAVVPARPMTMKPDEQADAELRHSDELERISWLSAGVGFRPNRPDLVDRAPVLSFDFGEEREIRAIQIYNYCERNLEKRGVKELEIPGFDKIVLAPGRGIPHFHFLPSETKRKTIEFKILSNHAGTTYPIPDDAKPDDNGFVGLAEVRFLVKDHEGSEKLVPLKGVSVTASSELVVDSHDRRATYLVDGSGLGGDGNRLAWNRQGLPFYCGKVAYSRSFRMEKKIEGGTYTVRLPSSPAGWYGSTAQVVVNGQSAGFVASSPWSVEVSGLIRDGENKIDVIVYGTPKNLLGPHHAGKLRGSAWPGSFHRAPAAQPPGAAYDTIGYGLFEPFTLLLTTK